jgi:hypothetical protein
MTRFLTILVAVTACCSLKAEEQPRVKIEDGTLVTAEGNVLRGTTFFVDLYGVQDMRDNEDKYHEYFVSVFKQYDDLNCVRIGPWMGNWKYDLAGDEKQREEYLHVIDNLVQWCEECGVYAIVNLHTQYKSDFDVEKAKAFWSLIAPRYKDRTHVIYELSNEPEPESSLAGMAEVYRHVKSLAPDTHQILFSHVAATQLKVDELSAATEGVDFSNASIGFHCYDNNLLNTVQWDHAQKLRDAGYPVICTEYLSLTNNNDMPIRYEALMHCMMRAEERKMAWVSWGPFAQFRNPNKKGWNHNALRYSPSFDSAMLRYGIDFRNGPQWPSTGRYRLQSIGNAQYLGRKSEDAWSELQFELPSKEGLTSTVWEFERIDGNIYRIRSGKSKSICLHGKFDDDESWQPTVTAEFHEDWNSQKFQLLRTGEGTFQILCRWGDLYLTAFAPHLLPTN